MRRSGSGGEFTLTTETLILVLVIMLTGSAAKAVARKGVRRQQEQPQGDDTECLRGLVDAVSAQGEEDENSTVATWIKGTAIRRPCNGTSALSGITCNSEGRVASIRVPNSSLVGNIPTSLASCDFLQTLDLSSNYLSGALPSWLGSLAFLSLLSLANNNLSGPIPYELVTLASLTSLDLSNNELSGSIPPQLGLLSLQFFNVSDNKLSGPIPATLSNTSTGSPRFDASSFANNPQLYGYPLPLYTSSSPSISYISHGLPVHSIVLIGLASGLGSLVLLYGVHWLWTLVRDHREEAKRERARQMRNANRSQEYIGWKEVLERL